MPRTVGYTTIPRDGLVGEWLLDGNANDTSGLGHNGTATDITYVSSDVGYVNQCASFNGSSSYIDVNNNLFSGLFSLNVWIKTTQSTGTYGSSPAYGGCQIVNADVAGSANDIIPLSLVEGYPVIGIGNSGGDYYTSSFPGNYQVNDGKYHMITIIRDPSSNNVYLYIDGKYISTQNNSLVSNNTNDQNKFRMGQEVPGNGTYFNGQIGLVRVYNRALTQQEIQALYQEGLRKLGTQYIPPRVEDGLVSAWDGDVNGTTWYDSKGNNNGTATDVSVSKQGLVNVGNFNGSSSGIESNNTFSDTVFTLSTFIKSNHLPSTTNWPNDYHQYIGTENTNATNYSFGFRTQGDNCEFFLSTSTGGLVDNILSNTKLSVGINYHVAASFDSSTKEAKLFINGKLDNSKILSTNNWNLPNHLVHIGCRGDDKAIFNGQIGLTRIYNRVLSEQEIQQLYQEGLSKLYLPNYSQPNLEEGKVLEISKPQVGGIYYDQSGNGNNGTATNVSDSTVGKVNVMSFNGSSSVLSIPKETMGIIGTQDFYVSGWYYLVDPGSGNFPLLFGSFQNVSPYIGPIIFFDPHNTESNSNGDAIKFRTTADNQFNSNTTASSLYNSWHHIVMTRISGTLYLYIDGVLDNSGTDNTNIGAADEAYICRNFSGQRRYGKTALVRVGVGKGLTATEVQQLYYSQKGNFIS